MAIRRNWDDSVYEKQSIKAIYIGIDFGTSYSKVSFSQPALEKRAAQIQTIKWDENDFYKKTSLYFYDNSLYFIKPNDSAIEIKYFKYSIINKTLVDSSVYSLLGELQNDFEEMCCIYFLAQLIKRSLEKIQKEYMLDSLEGIDVFVNMGAPLENFYSMTDIYKEKKGKYKTILDKAITLAGGSKCKAILPDNKVAIKNLDNICTELNKKEAILNFHTEVFPELAVEVLLYQQNQSIGLGLYSIIDIGGGTTDMAVFQKSQDSFTKVFHLSCHGEKVLPLGLEILKKKQKNTEYVDLKAKEYRETFYQLLVEATKHVGVNETDYKKTNIFFLGGGCNEKWYIDNIKEYQSRLSNTFIKLDFDYDIASLIQNDSRLIEKEQRLIISQMLAQSTDDIAVVQGFPNWFKAENKKQKQKDDKMNKKTLDDILREKGFADI